MERVKVTIIGAGIIGLSVASSVSEIVDEVLVLEKNFTFGMETSSRNSEVIHASIYYPQNSLKGQLCLQGNEMIYDLCKNHNIPHSNTKKLIVACTDDEVNKLPDLLETAKGNGAKGVRIIDDSEVQKLEPNIYAKAAMYCPTSGIVDSHSLMQYYEATALNNNAQIVYNSKVVSIEKTKEGYKIGIEQNEETFYILSEIVINSAGLNSGNIAAMLGIDIDSEGYKINYLKGIYFRVHGSIEKFPKALIYPVPPEAGSVGIHTTPDLAGGMRLGPYDFWVDEINYDVDNTYKEFFYKSVKPFLPFLEIESLHPDTSGIHPKVQKKGEPMKDFIIKHEVERGLENLINLVGMESPGVTSSPAIGLYIKNMVQELI